MVGLSCAAASLGGSWAWPPGPAAVIASVVLPLTWPGLDDVLVEDGFVRVAEALELPSVVRDPAGSGSTLLGPCGGLEPGPSVAVGLLLLSLENSFHLDRLSMAVKSR